MESHKLLNEKASSIKPYECPTTETLYVGAQSVICASETEKVEEIDGEMVKDLRYEKEICI